MLSVFGHFTIIFVTNIVFLPYERVVHQIFNHKYRDLITLLGKFETKIW